MYTSIRVATATAVALVSICALAQTAPAPGNDATPGNAPSRSAGASPQNPSVNGYKDSKPERSPGTKPRAQQQESGGGAMPSDPTGKDSMAKDNKPTHPAGGATKAFTGFLNGSCADTTVRTNKNRYMQVFILQN